MGAFTMETVTVLDKVQAGTDAFNAPIWEETGEDVEVLVQPGERVKIYDGNRPEGMIVNYTLHFQKTYDGDLSNKDVMVRGERCHVIGHPDHYTPENTPGLWDMPVTVERTEG